MSDIKKNNLEFILIRAASKHIGHIKVKYIAHAQAWTGTLMQKYIFFFK